MVGLPGWPSGVAAQIHYTLEDPFRPAGRTDAVAAAVRAAGAEVEVYDYPGRGHLFTDPSLPEEYDAEQAELLWARVLDFCTRRAAGR
jgi:dienelactone hydrolase